MPIDIAYEKYPSSIHTVEIGRVGAIKVGGETTLPFLFKEGAIPNPPVVGLEVFDCEPLEWPEGLKKEFGDVLKDPIKWAKQCVGEFGSKLLCVRLMSVHPDWGGRSANDAVGFLKALLGEVKVPLVIIGCGDAQKDNEVLARASQAVRDEKCLFGIATQSNYKTLAASCLADGHSIIAESPIDVNIAKQVNILISDMGFSPDRIVMHPTTGALGYGMEYVFSIMERARLAALSGDKMLSMPFILFTGQEVWRVKEAKESASLGLEWEIATATAMLHAGADIIIMRNPRAAVEITKFINVLMKH